MLGERAVAYTLRRSARRTLALQVDARGVRVAVPRHCPDAQVEAFIAAHAQWLLGKLAVLGARREAARFTVEDGALFPLHGRPCRVRLGGSGRSARWRIAPDGIEELVLPAAAADSGEALVRAMRARAQTWFAGRVAEYCHRLGVPLPAVRTSAARTRWGSCSRRSGIRLHWRLLHLPVELGDYVVAHEVAHLLEMNHSARFWSVVESLYPDWRAARGRLREAAASLPVIAPGDDTLIDQED